MKNENKNLKSIGQIMSGTTPTQLISASQTDTRSNDPRVLLHTTNQTRIKIVCYYSHRKDGTPYSIFEIRNKTNRRYHDIYSHKYTTGRRAVVRDDLALTKAIRHLELHKDKIFTFLLFANNWNKKEELLIGKYNRTSGLKYTPPKFKNMPNGDVIMYGVAVLDRWKMRIEKKPIYDPYTIVEYKQLEA